MRKIFLWSNAQALRHLRTGGIQAKVPPGAKIPIISGFFNVADSCICIAAGLFFLSALPGKKA